MTNNEKFSSKHLPGYAAWLFQNRLDNFTKEMLRLSFEMEIPLLKFFNRLSPEELFEMTKPGQVEFLNHLSKGKVKEHLESSMQRWLSDQLPLIGKYDVEAKDITIAAHIRSKVLKYFLKQYTSDVDEILLLSDEIDDLMLIYNTSNTDVYIKVLKEKITEESHFSSNLVNASPGITFIYDLAEQREVYITGKVQEVTGYAPDEVLNLSNLIAELTHPDDIAVVEEFVKRIITDKEGHTQFADYRIKTKNGSYIWMRCYAVAYKRDDNGRPLQILGVGYNISQEKEMAMALEKSEQQLLEAQSIGQIGSYEWDLINDYSISTPQLRKIFEADKRQTLEDILTHVHEEDEEKLRKALEEALISGTYQCEYRYEAKSGEKLIDSRGVVSFTKDGKAKTLIGTVQDVTERKKIETGLIQKAMELERSNEQLQQFAYIASHDLKEPLRKITMFSDLIITSEWDHLSEKTKANLQKIKDTSKRMQQLIEDVLSYSSLNLNATKENYSLEKAVREAINNLEFKIRETSAIIESDGLPKAEVIPFQMQQLFQNLLVNALKFSKKGVQPKISITHSVLSKTKLASKHIVPASKYLEIKVTDNGIGFSSDVSERIFGLFQRLHNKSAYEGSGLGLAICRKIVEEHGGTISASSEEGVSSTFTILLPF